VEGVDHRVAAAAARFGRQLGDDAARQRADRRDQREQPGAETAQVRELGQERLAVRTQRPIATQLFQDQALHHLQGGEERRAHQACRHADDGGVEQHPPDDPQVGGSRLFQDRRQKLAADNALHD